MFERFSSFLRESYIELRRVTWPTRTQMIEYTVAVVVMSIVLAAYLGALDFLFQAVLNRFIL